MSRLLRRYASEASLPGYYRFKFLRAAAEVENELRAKLELPLQELPFPKDDEQLHRAVNLLT